MINERMNQILSKKTKREVQSDRVLEIKEMEFVKMKKLNQKLKTYYTEL